MDMRSPVVTRQSNRLESEYREMTAANQSVLVSAVASDLAIRSYLLSGDRTYLDKFRYRRSKTIEALAGIGTELGLDLAVVAENPADAMAIPI